MKQKKIDFQKYNFLDSRQILSKQIAEHIVNLIIKKATPGDKLPTEVELVEMFGVIRPTIREAIKILVVTNAVEIVRGKGTFVTENPGLSRDTLGIQFIQDKDLILHLLEWRLIIEPGVAFWAAKKAVQSGLKKLKKFSIT